MKLWRRRRGEEPADFDSREEWNPRWPPSSRDADCCRQQVDARGRYPIGFCDEAAVRAGAEPSCIRRREVWRRECERHVSIGGTRWESQSTG